ncbi:GntR family transcriptional regulator [Brevibacterium casei]|uniref:DNA-binding transcriptional regulator, GntR family n=1 Tax=Brevibacterium casei CIP 102111 TaxID=1255625 RepID=A0A2H1IFI9_9MICO|nr:GntR family transcriptional regulator [Brevibacterium casei]QPR40395.1 GntR family transcriptional regulator [Brevibacterium casei]QPR44550.1 GntR family transcriptional regulator [Brevibacterium casei]SMX73836.1 DNA-binding transcriptional regulator, GntR family [Brevibacterium casei CIP 102111]
MRTTTGRGRRVGTRIGGPRSAVALAVDALRLRILRGDLAPGAHIGEQSLADELGVGRATLREALRDLEHDGLVVRVPGVGTRVISLSLEDAYEIVTLREHLEDLAVDLGVPASPARVERLMAAVADLERGAADGDEASSVPDSLAFHRAFIALSGNTRLTAAFETILYPLGLLMQLNRRASSAAESLSERAARHRRLAELVRAGDPEAVRAEMGSHRTTAFLRSGELSTEELSDAAKAWVEYRTTLDTQSPTKR